MATSTFFTTIAFSCVAMATPAMISVLKDEILQKLPKEEDKLRKVVKFILKIIKYILPIMIMLSEIICMASVMAFPFHLVTGMVLGAAIGIVIKRVLDTANSCIGVVNGYKEKGFWSFFHQRAPSVF